jgi:hypothetical protein
MTIGSQNLALSSGRLRAGRLRAERLLSRWLRGIVLGSLGFSLWVAGCSSKSGSGPPDAVEAGIAAKDTATPSYPAGPYGVGTGTVVADATFYGYPDFQDHTLQPFALDDFFNPDGTKTTSAGAPMTAVLLTVGAVWCNPCAQEASALPSVAGRFMPDGVQIVQDLFEGPDETTGAAATQSDLDSWINAHQLPFPVFIDPSKKLAPYFDVAVLPFVMLLDARTMVSLGEETGFGGQDTLEAFICEFAPQKPAICP